jgi:predicted Zn-dependent peptidase
MRLRHRLRDAVATVLSALPHFPGKGRLTLLIDSLLTDYKDPQSFITVAELEGIRGSRPLTSDELLLAKASLTKGYARNFETVQQVTRSVAQLALYGLPDSYFAEFIPRVTEVSGADVTRVAEQYLDPAKLTTLVVGDHSVIADSLQGLGLGDPQVMPPEL